MSEYMKLIARTGIRFSGAPVTLSPQLEDLGIEHVLYHLSSERNVVFRAILYVADLDAHQVRITFPTAGILEVRYNHDFIPMDKKQQRNILWSRDCTYHYRLPNSVSKEQLTALWTNDGFLVIQARGIESLTPGYNVERLIPTKVCAILKPYMDIVILIDSLRMHKCEIASIIEYLERKGLLSEDKDVLRLLVDYPGKPKITSPQKSPQKSAPQKSPLKSSPLKRKIAITKLSSETRIKECPTEKMN